MGGVGDYHPNKPDNTRTETNVITARRRKHINLHQSVSMEDQQALLRLFNPLSPTTRRTTRVLQEIEAHGMSLEELRISQQQPVTGLALAAPTNTQPAQNRLERRRLSGANFDDSFGQSGSPDEQVIQARGRRQVPLTFSPDINTTPLRQQMASSMTALKKGNFSKDEIDEIKKKMMKLRDGSDEINICVKYLEDQTAEA